MRLLRAGPGGRINHVGSQAGYQDAERGDGEQNRSSSLAAVPVPVETFHAFHSAYVNRHRSYAVVLFTNDDVLIAV
jgi:hypothetical protein